MRAYEYRHVVGFEETNLVGNVYYVNHLRWQGRCREMFLHDQAPGVLDQLAHGLVLATVRCSCEYYQELRAFDQIVIRMRLASSAQNRIGMDFEYWRIADGQEELVARGQQEIACLRKVADQVHPVPIPEELREALRAYGNS